MRLGLCLVGWAGLALAACGGQSFTVGGDSGGGGAGGNGGAASGGAAGAGKAGASGTGPKCDVADSADNTPKLSFTLHNSTANNLFFGPPTGGTGCTRAPFPVTLKNGEGTVFVLWQDPCVPTCEQLVQGEACPADCPVPTLTKIAQGGAWLVETPAFYYAPMELPASCESSQAGGVPLVCNRRLPLPEGLYTIQAAASRNAYCISTPLYCDCDKNTDGNCEILNALTDVGDIVGNGSILVAGGNATADVTF
jgi:hypothetical protein